MKSFTRQEEEAALVAAGVIVEIVGADAVWLFAARSRVEGCTGGFFREVGKCETVHLYMLAFAPGISDGAEQAVNEAVGRKTGGSMTVTLLVYNAQRLSRVKGNHRVFLHRVVGGFEPLHVREGYAIPEFGSAVVDEKAKNDYWNHCKYMAVCCLEGETAIENPNAEPVQAVLLHQAAEQVCLGLIYNFLGCRPNYFELGYLIELCALFMPGAFDIFPRASAEEQGRFAVLSLRMESLRYRVGHPSVTDIEVLRSRVHRFLGIATEAVDGRPM